MPFYALTFTRDLQKQTLLKHILAQSPNGTPLCFANANFIYTELLMNGDIWVCWLDNEYVTPERLDSIRSLDGVVAFYEIDGVPVTIHDSSWTWNDNYINAILLPHLKGPDNH